jgi:hypothetical protein
VLEDVSFYAVTASRLEFMLKLWYDLESELKTLLNTYNRWGSVVYSTESYRLMDFLFNATSQDWRQPITKGQTTSCYFHWNYEI